MAAGRTEHALARDGVGARGNGVMTYRRPHPPSLPEPADCSPQSNRPCALAFLRVAKGKDTDTLPGRVKHSICNRRSYRRNTRLSDTRWGSRRFDDVNLYGWHFVDPQHVVSVEIAFDNPSLIKRNPRFENRAQSKANASLHLCAHLIGIYRYAAINGTHNTMHPGKATC